MFWFVSDNACFSTGCFIGTFHPVSLLRIPLWGFYQLSSWPKVVYIWYLKQLNDWKISTLWLRMVSLPSCTPNNLGPPIFFKINYNLTDRPARLAWILQKLTNHRNQIMWLEENLHRSRCSSVAGNPWPADIERISWVALAPSHMAHEADSWKLGKHSIVKNYYTSY